ncbi:MAG: tRNA (adenosine(37)-N6)-threonylcarbamoyltransferase complex ATPase subunit type 1 TsaE [Bacilli bacterium]|nr:tRNA (adenosine(37)-N6)-threonylcarbamoyltransferase complex ATPase subunit type 1 TsaE [Bacilli bacterium]
MLEKVVISNSKEETMNLAKRLADKFTNGTVICLTGDLGAGKTTFVRGLAEGLNIKEIVQSPTFNIMKIYLKGDRPLIHIDAYRLADINTDIGLDEYIGYETGITVIEWPMFIENLIPNNSLNVEIINLGDDRRQIKFIAKEDSLLEIIK